MTSLYVVVMGSLIGALAWLFLAFKIPFVPFGRTLGTFGCAVLTLVFCVLSPADAFASVNLETLALLFGTMLISVLLEREGFFSLFVHCLTYRCTSALALLLRVCLASALLSALMTNDTVCVFFTPVIVDLCELHQLPHGPFLIALATSANIGSTATPVGNPQNMIIASLSGITYPQFILYIGPAMVLCLLLNIGMLTLMYRGQLRGREVKVCRGRFVRATEEEMEARLGKDWETEVAAEQEREQRRSERRARERKQEEGLDLLPPPASAQGAEGEEEAGQEMDDLTRIKRRKGVDLTRPAVRVDEEEKVAGSEAGGEHRVDIQPASSTLPTGAAQQAESMVKHGERDEEAKAWEDEKKPPVQGESDLPAPLSSHTGPTSSSDSLSLSPHSTSPDHPPLMHADSLALLLYHLQVEQRVACAADSGHTASASVVGDEEGEEDAEMLKRRRLRTRVATAHQPRRKGRTLIQLPPVLSPAVLARLERAQWKRRVTAGDDAVTSSTASQPSSIPPSPLSFLQLYLPASLYLRLVLLPFPSKLLLFFLCLLGTVGAFAGGCNLGWAALAGACAMLVIDWREPDTVISLVDWSLLVFFTSLFVVTQGFQATNIPLDVWTALQGTIDVERVVGLVVYSLIVLVGSNTVSNVPLVLLLGPSIPSLSNPLQSWLLLSFVSTVAGNLTLVGSVANLIVASRAKGRYHLTFWELTRYGFPSTLLVTVVGVLVIKGTASLG